jgi:hypothetical protein
MGSTYQAHISKFTPSIVVNGTNKIDVTVAFTNVQTGELGYENDLYIKFGDRYLYKYLDTTSSSPQTFSFTIPVDWLNEIPDKSVATGTIELTCLDVYAFEVAYKETKPFTIYVPEEYKPTVSNLSVSFGDIRSMLVDYALYGLTTPRARAFVQPHSTSPIKKWYIAGGGVIASGEDPDISDNNDYNFSERGELIKALSHTTFTLTVEDARGRTASIESEQFYVQSYHRPIVKSLSAYRTDKDGIAKADGDYIKVTVEGAKSSIKDSEDNECNSLACYVDWKEANGSYSNFADITNNEPFIFEAKKDTNFEIKCTLRDKYMETVAYANVIGDNKDFNIADGGGGAAIGMKATKDYFDVLHKTRLQKNLSAKGTISSEKGLVSTGTGSKGDFLSFGKAERIFTDYHQTAEGNWVVNIWGDFNDCTSLGLYGVYNNNDVSSSNYYKVANAPCEKAGTLRVYCANGDMDESSTYRYIMQEYVVYDGSAVYRRCLSKTRDNSDVEWPANWTFGSWYRYSGTKV